MNYASILCRAGAAFYLHTTSCRHACMLQASTHHRLGPSFIILRNSIPPEQQVSLQHSMQQRITCEGQVACQDSEMFAVEWQALSVPTTRQNSNGLGLSDLPDGSIPAGPPMSSMSSSALERVPSHTSSPTSPFVLNGVLSLANAGTWLQMLRQKLINANAERGRPDLVDPDATDETASERAAVVTDDDFPVPAPMRRSRSDGFFDRQSSCRRGAEMLRPSRAGTHVRPTYTQNRITQ